MTNFWQSREADDALRSQASTAPRFHLGQGTIGFLFTIPVLTLFAAFNVGPAFYAVYPDIPQMTSKFVEIVPLVHRQGNGISFCSHPMA